jgi:hypothetical protein
MLLDIIHRLVFCLKWSPVYISKQRFGDWIPQVEPTLLGPIDRAILHLRI